MRTCLAVVVLALCAGALAACGGSGSSGSPSATMQAYIDAIASGDGKGVCTELTGPALSQRGGKSCVAAVTSATRKLTPQAKQQIGKLKFTVASEQGDKATVRVLVPGAACPAAKVQLIDLVKKDGDWLISRTSDTACAPTS